MALENSWVSGASAADNVWQAVTWSPDLSLFCAVAGSGTNNRVMTSPDGITWTTRTSAADNGWRDVVWSPELSLFCVVSNTGTGDRVMTSPDGVTWTTRTSATDNNWRGITWSPELSLFCAVANSGTLDRVMTSPDGITWTSRTTPAAENLWVSVTWSPELSLFCTVAASGVGSSDQVMTSPDGITWTIRTSANNTQWSAVTWSPELSLFCAVSVSGTSQRVSTSPDGINWTIRTAPSSNNWVDVTWSPELSLFCAVSWTGTGDRVMTSPDGINWTARTNATDNNWAGVAWSPELSSFCAVASTGTSDRAMVWDFDLPEHQLLDYSLTGSYTPSTAFNWDFGVPEHLLTDYTLEGDHEPSTAFIWGEFVGDTGTLSVTIQSDIYEVAAISVTIENDIVIGTGVLSVTAENNIYEAASVSVTIENDIVIDIDTVSVTIENDVVIGIGTLSATIQSDVYEAGVASVTIENDIVIDIAIVSVTAENSIYEAGSVSVGIENDIVIDIATISVTIENDIVIGTGIQTVVINSNIYEVAGVSVTIENDIVIDIQPLSVVINSRVFETDYIVTQITSQVFLGGSLSVSFEQTQISTAEPITLTVRQSVFSLGTVAVNIQQDITELTYTASVTIEAEITETQSIKLGIYQSIYSVSSGVATTPAGTVIPAGLTNPISSPSYWTARVLLDGDDVSANLTGTLNVDNEEDAASVCQFTLNPTFGLVDLTKWVGVSVRVFFVKTDSSKNVLTEFLLFNGFVDVPTYDPQSRLTSFTCTDELQKAFESSTKEQIDTVVGGYWSPDVFSEEVDKWTYAQDRLSTIPYSMNYNVNRSVVKTPWAAKATPDFTMNEAVVFDNSLSVELGNSRGIVNQVDIAFGYQYDTFKEVAKSYSWAMRPDVGRVQAIFGAAPVTAQMVLDAAESDSWVLGTEPYFKAWPPSGWFDGIAVINADRTMVVGTSFRVSKRYRQYVNEVTTHSLKASKSIASLGKLPVTEEYNLTTEYSEDADAFDATIEQTGTYEAELNTFFADTVEDNVPTNPSWVGVVDVPFTYSQYKNTYDSTLVNGVEIFDFSSAIVENSRDDLSATVEAVQNLHKSVILKSHRGNSVGFTCLIEPTLTREHTVKVDTVNVVAQGKVRQVTHTLDINAGSALSEVVIGISRSTAVGITDVETPLDSVVPEAVVEAEASDDYAPVFLGNWVEADQSGFRTGTGMEALYGGTQFLVPLPAVNQESIDEVTVNTEKEFIIDVPDEELTLNA